MIRVRLKSLSPEVCFWLRVGKMGTATGAKCPEAAACCQGVCVLKGWGAHVAFLVPAALSLLEGWPVGQGSGQLHGWLSKGFYMWDDFLLPSWPGVCSFLSVRKHVIPCPCPHRQAADSSQWRARVCPALEACVSRSGIRQSGRT